MVTMVTKLPQFTDYIKGKLNKTKEVWSKVINISAEFYLDKFPNISHSSEYQAIGEKMYRIYPDVSHSHGSTPWGPLRFLPCLQYVERNTQMDKGKGVKSSSILIHKKDIPDEQKDKSVESKEEEAPKLVLFTEGTDKLEEVLVEGDQCLNYTNGENSLMVFSFCWLFIIFLIYNIQDSIHNF